MGGHTGGVDVFVVPANEIRIEFDVSLANSGDTA
jgi:hypothetical protein